MEKALRIKHDGPPWSIDDCIQKCPELITEHQYLGRVRYEEEDWDAYITVGEEKEQLIVIINDNGSFFLEHVEDIDEESFPPIREGLQIAIEEELTVGPDVHDDFDADVSFLMDAETVLGHTIEHLGNTRVHWGGEYFALGYCKDLDVVIAVSNRGVDNDNSVMFHAGSAHKHLQQRWADDDGTTAIWRAILRVSKVRKQTAGDEHTGASILAKALGHVWRITDRGAVRKALEKSAETNTAAAAQEEVEIGVKEKKKVTDSKKMTSSKKSTDSGKSESTGKVFRNVTVARSADEQIHIPEGMTLLQARDWLTRIEEKEEQVIRWQETIDAYPFDGALALRRVFESRFGNAVKESASEVDFFGKEHEVPPSFIAVEIGVGKTTHVPWGEFTIPAIPEHKIRVGVEYKNKQFYFVLGADIRRKYEPLLKEIAEQVRREVKARSIYKGKAIRIQFPDEHLAARGFNPHEYIPKFIEAKTNGGLILSEHVLEQVETNLFTPVAHTAKCRAHNIPLKRGILLEGTYGTGKTLTATTLAELCVKHGWTFIYLSDVTNLEQAMHFARRYEPAVIFAEDIDQVMEDEDGESRDEGMNNILNTIDGVDMKNVEQMVVLTSNHVEKITRAMLRPGRLDAVITIEPPDQGAVVKLLRQYASGLLDSESDAALLGAAQILSGQIPSVIREVVERSKLAAIRRSKENEEVKINGKDLEVAARGIMNHVKLLKEPVVDGRSDIEKAADRLGTYLTVNASLRNGTHPVPAPMPSTRALPSAD